MVLIIALAACNDRVVTLAHAPDWTQFTTVQGQAFEADIPSNWQSTPKGRQLMVPGALLRIDGPGGCHAIAWLLDGHPPDSLHQHFQMVVVEAGRTWFLDGPREDVVTWAGGTWHELRAHARTGLPLYTNLHYRWLAQHFDGRTLLFSQTCADRIDATGEPVHEGILTHLGPHLRWL